MKKKNSVERKSLSKKNGKLFGEILSSVQKQTSGKVIKVRFGK